MLRQLDRKLLPPLAARLARLGRAPVRMPVVAGAAAVSASAVLIVAAWVVGQQPANTGPDGSVRVGVGTGDSIPQYVDTSRSELAAMLADRPPVRNGDTYALVAFGAYLSPDRLPGLLDGASVAAVFARVPVAGDAEAVRIPVARVPDDVTLGMDRAAADRESRAARLEALSAGLRGGGTQEVRMRTEYEVDASAARVEAAAYRVHCACLYAAVVRGRPAMLNVISGRPEIRAVDPAPEVSRVDEAVFVPPLPEQNVAWPTPSASPPSPVLVPTTVTTPPLPAPAASQPQATESPDPSFTTDTGPTIPPTTPAPTGNGTGGATTAGTGGATGGATGGSSGGPTGAGESGGSGS